MSRPSAGIPERSPRSAMWRAEAMVPRRRSCVCSSLWIRPWNCGQSCTMPAKYPPFSSASKYVASVAEKSDRAPLAAA